MLKQSFSLLSICALVGCQTIAPPPPVPTTPPPTPIKTQTLPSGIKITPYEPEEIKRQDMRVILPEQKITQQFDDGQNLPAFKQLMLNTQNAIDAERWQQAERYALQAQRLAPQSAQPFLYLAKISNQQQKFDNAAALAQRGLSYAQDQHMQKQLWQVILYAGQQTKNSQRVQQAQQALASL